MEITKEEINEYKKEKLTFQRYWKYQFFYTNERIEISTKGIAEDIYRAEFVPEMSLEEIVNEAGTDLYIRFL